MFAAHVDDALDRLDRERAARGIAARALHEHDGRWIVAQGRGQRNEVRVAGERAADLPVLHAARGERVRRIDQRVAQRVVRRAVRAEQQLPGNEQRIERGHDRVRAADDRQARQHALGAKNAGQQRFIAVARRVVVAVTGRAGQVALRDALGQKRFEHAHAHGAATRIVFVQPRQRRFGGGAHHRIDAPVTEYCIDHALASSIASYMRTNGR